MSAAAPVADVGLGGGEERLGVPMRSPAVNFGSGLT
jgi:hypothetical protein